MREQRRLAAILAADVVGYSRLMGRDESGTHARLREHRKERFEPTLTRRGGRIVKLTGDGALAEFSSAVDALSAAIEFQQAMAQANQNKPEDTAIVFRIGLHLGDLIVEDDDLYGDGVNVAARLEGEALPGGIVISGAVHQAVAGKLKAAFDDLGSLNLKNIERSTQAYRVSWQASDWQTPMATTGASSTDMAAPAAEVTLALPDKPSIAVLPFTNMSGDPEQDYFADGITEDIITALSRFRSLFVIARNSTFVYKGRAIDVRKVAHELGVRYVLEGSVRKAANRVRITGQLIVADSGAHIWAERYDGDLVDIFELQDKVTSEVVGAIAPRLDLAEIDRARSKPTENLGAYDYYLRGMAKLHQGTREATQEALDLFYGAIGRDSDFALPCAMAAWCYDLRKWNGWTEDREREAAETVRLAQRAVELGKDDAVALCWGGFALARVAGHLESGAACLEKAIALNENLAPAWHFSGWVCAYLADPATGIDRITRAMRLSPRDPFAFLAYGAMAFACIFAGRHAEAVTWAQKSIQEQPGFMASVRMLAASYALSDRLDDARATMLRAREFDPTFRTSDVRAVTPLRRPEDLAKYVDALRLAGMPD